MNSFAEAAENTQPPRVVQLSGVTTPGSEITTIAATGGFFNKDDENERIHKKCMHICRAVREDLLKVA